MDPFNQRAVYDGIGFIHLLTKELWDGHPCCAFTVSKEFATQNPNSYFVWNEWNNLSIANIVTAILLIGLVGLLLDQGLAYLAKLVTYPE